MRSRLRHPVIALIVVASFALIAAGCGDDDDDNGGSGSSNLSGTIAIDGSSTVGPITETAAELFREENPDAKITVGISGTGGGFEKFCAGETDINDASRAIEPDEEKACAEKGIKYDAAAGRQRRHRADRQPGQRLGRVPDHRPAEEDLGQGLRRRRPGRTSTRRSRTRS